MQRKKSYVLRLLITIDAFFNVLLLNGSEDHTISGRVGYKAHTTKKRCWLIAQAIINTLFFFEKNHCYRSIEWDEVGNYTENNITQVKQTQINKQES